jgi:hypothetical protein
MMNWLAIPRPELCFPGAGSFGTTWFGVTYSAGSLPAHTRKLRVRTFLQKDTTGLIQSIMRIRLHSNP